jgi:hypothetical protein
MRRRSYRELNPVEYANKDLIKREREKFWDIKETHPGKSLLIITGKRLQSQKTSRQKLIVWIWTSR